MLPTTHTMLQKEFTTTRLDTHLSLCCGPTSRKNKEKDQY
jgi:hypothetical protein